MGWETDYVLEGLWTFGAPLNIWKMEIAATPPLSDPLSYDKLHLKIDDDASLWVRLMELVSSTGTLTRLNVVQVGSRDHYIESPRLYSLQRGYKSSDYPYETWPGATLGIAFDKTPANDASMAKLFRGYDSIYHRAQR